MSIPITLIIPLIGQLLNLSLKIAEIIDRSDDINAEDKQAIKAAIKKARDGVTYWNEEGT
jgi:hypothetical protein